ncbi:MAG: TonB-dependent receptor [Ignavibacteriaceae bacterium]|nr:TonB-dependent receptor [Ignavibacteriaceae bacterium]
MALINFYLIKIETSFYKIGKYILNIALLVIVLAANLFAGVTGKIQGVVFDKKTGDKLPSVNIIVVGTNYGSATNINGEYFILQVPPGEYTVKFSMIGFKDFIVRDVKVRAELTTRIDAHLEETTLDIGGEVVVIAERPVIQKDVTASIQFLGGEEIIRLPVTDAKEGLFVQAGVFFDPIPVVGGLGSAGRGETRYSIRGGSQDEIKWFFDGVRTASLVNGRADWGGSFTNLNMNSIQEVQIMTGGFTAEYGEAQSGVISVVTKEGADKFNASVDYIYGFPGQHHFGNYLYDPKSQKEFIDNTLPDGSLDPAWWTPYRQRQIYDYRTIPDHTLYASFGGPLISVQDMPLKFFISSQFKRQAYTLPHPRSTRNTENFFANLSTRGKNVRLRLNGSYNHDAHSTLQENGDFTSQAKYYRGWGSLIDTYNWSLSGLFTHVLNDDLFYEVKLSTYNIEFKEGPSEYTELGRSKNPTLFGFMRYDGFEGEPFDQYSPIIKNNIVSGDISLVGNLNWQFNSSNLLKTGFEFRYNTYSEKESWRLPSFTDNLDDWINRGLNETYHPIQFAFYVQNKMEFESMILNVGLRFDYFDPNRLWFERTNYFNLAIDPIYNPAKDPDLDQVDSLGHVKYSFENVLNKKRTPARTYGMLSPRFGVSFPITENSLLHFNYGHYYQMPPLDQMFEFLYFRPVNLVEQIIAERNLAQQEGRAPRHIPSNDGDPERVVAYTPEPLKPQKTIMFEAGIKHNFEDIAVLDVTAFYKDVFDQTEERVGLFDRAVRGYDPFRNQISPNQSYAAYFTGDYGDSRGFEISLRSLFSKVINIDLNYSFSRSTSGRASPKRITYDANGNATYEWDTEVNKRIPTERSFSRPHIFRANLFLSYPKYDESTILNTLLDGTSLSILYRFVSGQTFTYLQPNDPPDTYDNYRYPVSHNVDLKIDKMIRISGSHEFIIYLQITNLFNTKNLRSYGDVVFDANATKDYVESGEIKTVDAAGYDISWQNYYDKRRFYLGFKYSF